MIILTKQNIFLILVIVFFNTFNKAGAQTFKTPDSVDVLHYEIHIGISDFALKQITAKTKISLKLNTNNAYTISLGLKQLTVDSVTYQNRKLSFTHQGEKLTVFSEHIHKTNDTLTLTVYYKGNPAKDARWGGIYWSPNDVFNMGVGMQSYPHGFGRAWFPCNDSFTDKALYDFYITVKKPLKAICSGILMDTISNGHSTTWHWKMNQPIATYLASFAVSVYDLIERYHESGQKQIPVQIYTWPQHKQNAEQSFINVVKALEAFEYYFTPYAWDRVGYVEVSFRAGAMEHACNISMASYVFDGTLDNEAIIAHELSHAWFGNMVTCQTAPDMWLNEGWASYCEYLFYEYVYGKKIAHNYLRYNLANVLENTAKSDKGYFPVQGISKELTYGSTVYDKGALVVHNLRNYLGDSLFFGATQVYLRKYAFANATTVNLKQVFEQYSGLDLSHFFDFWVYGYGFPDYHIAKVTRTQKGTNFNCNVQINRTMLGTTIVPKSDKLQLVFYDSVYTKHTHTYLHINPTMEIDTLLPFNPLLVLINPDMQLSEASVQNIQYLKNNSPLVFEQTDMEIMLNANLPDSVLVATEKHFTRPDYKFPKNVTFTKDIYYSLSHPFSDKTNGSLTLTIKGINTANKNTASYKVFYRKQNTVKWKPIAANVQIVNTNSIQCTLNNLINGDLVVTEITN